MDGRLAILALVGLAACDHTPEGTHRTYEAHWDALDGSQPVVRCRVEQVYLDGRWVKAGLAVFFDSEGRQTHRGQYTRGLESGPWWERNEDGSTAKGSYVEGRRTGTWTYLREKGSRAERGDYLQGRREALWTAWYEDGRVLSEVTWKDGVQDGPARFWNPDGSLDGARGGIYRDGVKVR